MALQLVKLYKRAFYKYFLLNQCLSRIEDIDLIKMEIIAHTRGINAPIHLKFDEIIKDEDFINSFSSSHSFLIGYYYGVYYFKLSKKTYPDSYFNCFKNDLATDHMIHGLDRQGNLIFLDKISNTQVIKSPKQISENRALITKFPPIQSCYIGMLVGIYNAKSQKITTNDNSSKLKLV